MASSRPPRPKLRDTVKRDLLVKSGNRCAYPSCRVRPLREDGAWVGEYAHIEAESPGGPRYNVQLAENARNEPPNLILMCRNHHKVIDSKASEWPVERLKDLKRQHEATQVREVSAVKALVRNITDGTLWAPPERLDILDPDGNRDPDEVTRDAANAAKLARALAKVPERARSVLALILSLGTQIYHPNIEVEIAFDVLSEHASTSKADLMRQLKVLDTKSFGSLAEPDEYEPAMALVCGSTAYMGWEFFQALNLLGEYGIADDEREAIIRSVIVDLDFTALDAE